MIKIALDAMGGDHAPHKTVEGAILAVKECDLHVILVGKQDVISQELARYKDYPQDRISIHHASEVIKMAEPPAEGYRKKKDASISVGVQLVKDGIAQAFVSAGNTGAVMTASVMKLGRIEGVERPAIATIIPTIKEHIVMLDMGSSMDSKPQHLAQYALMGHHFAKSILHIETPRVALLNVGEEETKGDELTKAAHLLLKDLKGIQFIGNIEGKHILNGDADVIVCDGFVGNAILKFGEGFAKIIANFFKAEAKRSLVSLLGLMILKPGLKRFFTKFDYEEHGGAPLLGVNGISIIAHGSSNEIALKNALFTAYEAYDANMVKKIERSICP